MSKDKKSKKIDRDENEDYNVSDEIVIEEEISDNGALKKLRDRLKKAVEEKQEYLEGWQRTKADFVNFKKGEEDRKAEILKFAKEDIVTEILPVLDSFNMAKESDIWTGGLQNIYKQLISVLEKHGLKEENPLGQDFNPNEHEAIEMVSSEESEDGKVMEVVQLGYSLNKKIIRPSRVKVGKFEK